MGNWSRRPSVCFASLRLRDIVASKQADKNGRPDEKRCIACIDRIETRSMLAQVIAAVCTLRRCIDIHSKPLLDSSGGLDLVLARHIWSTPPCMNGQGRPGATGDRRFRGTENHPLGSPRVLVKRAFKTARASAARRWHSFLLPRRFFALPCRTSISHRIVGTTGASAVW